MQQPIAKQNIEYDEIEGVKIPDPYRWLEDINNGDVKDWITKQNTYTNSKLKDENFKVISDELIKNYKSVDFLNLTSVKGKYFYKERQPDENQMVLYMKEGMHGDPIKLIDPNGQKEDNTVTIDFWEVSPDGKYLVYGISEGGNEMATLYIKDLDTKRDLSDTIPNCRYSDIEWLSDSSGFFYTRNPRTGEVPDMDLHLFSKVYFHHLGDNPDIDQLIFGEDRPKDDMVNLTLSVDDRYLAIHVSQTWTENEVYIYDRETKETKLIITGIPSKFNLLFLKNKAIVITNYNANNYRVLSTLLSDLDKPIEQWDEFIPENKHVLEFIDASSNKIFAGYMVNASSQVKVFAHDGKELESLPLPPYSSIMGISARRDEEEFFFGVSSFTFPRIMYHYDPNMGSYEVIRRTDNPLNPDEYDVKQEWFTSKDGTKIPMFIFHRKDVDLETAHPTILYGYGGFGSGITPYFMKNWIPWMERGGIFVIANIRGGNEFGVEWHKSGIKENKQNTFDDFIAAAEYLIEKKYTTSNQLGILGASNGGLLVSTVAVQRPELFNAVASLVPLTDIVRFPQFGIAMRWIHEYGDPKVKTDLERILTWSPYHNVKEGVKYPNFLFTTAEKDTRVDPLHARKMVAMLQSVQNKNDVLIFTETEAGHGPGKPILKIVEEQGLILNFFMKKLGLKV